MATDPVTTFLARFSLRDLGHALFAAAAVLVPALVWTSFGALKVSLFAALPAVATVLFRQLFPNVNVTPGQVNTAVGQLDGILSKVKAPPVVATVVNDAAKVADTVLTTGVAIPFAPSTPSTPAAPGA